MDLKPCECGEDINEYFRMQILWQGRQTIGVAFCAICKRAEPFKFDGYWEQGEIDKAGHEAWNNPRETN